MTTIAMKKEDKVVKIAWDTLVVGEEDGTTYQMDKAIPLNSSIWVGVAGSMRDLQKMKEVGSYTPEMASKVLDEHEESEAIMLFSGEIFFISPGLVIKIDKPFVSIGTGAAYATAAMHLGKSPLEAVTIAEKYDLYTGGTINSAEVRLW